MIWGTNRAGARTRARVRRPLHRRRTTGLFVAAFSLSGATIPHVDRAAAEAAAVDDSVDFDQVGARISGGTPIASANLSRVAVTPVGRPLAVRVYDWDGLRWSPVGEPIVGGSALAMSGDGRRLVVGDPHDGAGRVRILEWDGTEWAQLGGDLVGHDPGDFFGRAVAVSFDGHRVAIGAAGDATFPSPPGYVRVFEWDGSSWSQMGDDVVGDSEGAGFGWSLTMSATGDRWAASERPVRTYEDDMVAGVTRALEWDGTAWSQLGADLPAAGDGAAMSGAGERIAIGYEGGGEPAIDGRVWVFDLEAGIWSLVDLTSGPHAKTVSLSADGRRLVFSGNRSNQPVDVDRGATYVRDELDTGWTEVGVIRGEFYASYDFKAVVSADGDRIAIGNVGATRVFDISATPFPPLAAPVPLEPTRLYDSRFGAETVDGAMAGRGRRAASSITEIPVGGRGGVPPDASGVMLSVVAVGPDGDGHLTVFPCGDEVPLSSNLNYAAGQVIANSVFTGLSDTGTVCVLTFAGTDLVVDVTGYAPLARSALRPVEPDRLVDSREGIVIRGYETWDEVDRLAAGSVTEFSVGGWPNRPVPLDAKAVILDVVAVDPADDGFLTVYPCGMALPLASSVNYTAGRTIANLVFAGIGDVVQQRVCLYTSATLDVVVDVTGYTLDDDSVSSLVPARLLDSRPGESTVDGAHAGIGRRPAGSITEIQVAGRGGVPADASTAILNVVAVDPDGDGHLTVFPCGTDLPLASNLNYAAGQVIANSAFAKIGTDGKVCIHTYATTDLVVDVNGAA